MPPSFVGEVGVLGLVVTLRTRRGSNAAGTDVDETVGIAPVAGNISAVRFIPDAAMTGATATATTLTLNNKTATLAPATFAFITGQNLVAYTSKALTLGAAASLVVVLNDVLAFTKTHASTGTADPAGVVEVDITRADTL